jgi:hypothetical protein
MPPKRKLNKPTLRSFSSRVILESDLDSGEEDFDEIIRPIEKISRSSSLNYTGSPPPEFISPMSGTSREYDSLSTSTSTTSSNDRNQKSVPIAFDLDLADVSINPTAYEELKKLPTFKGNCKLITLL